MSFEPLIQRGLFPEEELKKVPQGTLAEKYFVPPFSVFRKDSWKEREREWKSLGIKSELGRDEGITYSTDIRSYYGGSESSQTSIFSPTLTELLLRWFAPAGCRVLDPFAGGSVRGVVSSFLGYEYTGVDLSERQLISNREQAEAMGLSPEWLHGDSRELASVLPEGYEAEFMLTCPPYGSLEQYSDDPRDLSAMTHESFLEAFEEVLAQAYDRLSSDSFAAIVIGDLRGTDGLYKGLPAQTIAIAQKAGFGLYNEIALVHPAGTAPMRASSYFKNRKVVRIHESVLVLVKGSWRKAVARLETPLDDLY